MKVIALSVVALTSLFSAGVAQAAVLDTLSVSYFEISEASGYYGATVPGGDFGHCCSSPPATLPYIAIGSSLDGGLPVTSGGPKPVVDVSGSGQILWWTPSAANGVTYTGSGVVTLPYSSNMYAPNSTGNNDSTYYETAIFSGAIHGTGADVQLTVGSDDDSLVYLNGKYVGGSPGVHGTTDAMLNLGDLSGYNSLEIFYADRAQTGANFNVSISGASVSAVPEPSTWVMMLVGFGGLGFAAYRRNKVAALVA
ncbi:PEPxxWA-CTERM sorting domain-containing protein [Rhodoblastus sp.]|uniref:PEPxxWA-CTERM sorting domain-containing protein n=1 Tax=Rhodoblastus sp. TaxID=1962975 RepID=UPI003F96434E